MTRLLLDISNALRSGSDNRPGLPEEIVLHIFFIGGFIAHDPQMDIYEDEGARVYANNSAVKRKCWTAASLDRTFTARPGGVRLTTVSRHQGWVSLPNQGSWSWLELAVVPAEDVEVTLQLFVYFHSFLCCS